MFLHYLPCIHVWGTPLGLSLEDMLRDPSLILIMKNENPHKEQSVGFELLVTALLGMAGQVKHNVC
jgi:hypothetical protein